MQSSGTIPKPTAVRCWSLTLCGLFFLVLAILVLSGPGRIDIVDGQVRYLVARSLLDHGDPAIRDPDINFTVLPGRDGNRYSTYRFPHSLLGVPAIWLADVVGPASELRRQFYFAQVAAVLGAVLAVIYALWFRGMGHSPKSATGWALAGILCTPSWFYATTSFDDLLGTVLVVAAVGLAWWGRGGRPLTGAVMAGLALGLAFNAKQPLAIFVLPLMALVLTQDKSWHIRLSAGTLLLGGLAIGLAAYKGYDLYKFPPGTTENHARLLERELSAWPGNTTAGLFGLLLSPAAGVFWYCPPLVLALAGLVIWQRREPLFVAALAIACAVFLVFISTMTIFKGDPAWGPRYMTPVFGLLWLFAPTAAIAWPHRLVNLLLALGLLVQLLGLSVDPHRLYVFHGLTSTFYHKNEYNNEWIYFQPAIGHLGNRPREILEILNDDGSKTSTFSPAALATSAPPIMEREYMDLGPDAVRKYRCLASFRPWWISQQWLAPPDRPVALLPTVALLLGMALAGLGLMVLSVRRSD